MTGIHGLEPAGGGIYLTPINLVATRRHNGTDITTTIDGVTRTVVGHLESGFEEKVTEILSQTQLDVPVCLNVDVTRAVTCTIRGRPTLFIFELDTDTGVTVVPPVLVVTDLEAEFYDQNPKTPTNA